MRFLVDAQLPVALAQWLRERGHPSEHVLEMSLGRSSDSRVWEYAMRSSATIITKDEDFAEWVRRGASRPVGGVVKNWQFVHALSVAVV